MAATVIEKELIGWIPYRPSDQPSVPQEQWGKDHWSTLAYLECRAVNNEGTIKNANMRCNARRHRPFANIGPDGRLVQGDYPTRLANGETKADHDDWDCAFDLADAGYIRLWWTDPVEHVEMFGYAQARVEFTGEGLYLAHALRAHKAGGGTMATFHGAGAA